MLPSTRVTVGTMNFGGRTSRDEALRIVRRALERGATFFDTANVYGDGASETILGEALRESGLPRDAFGVATKVGLKKREGLSASALRTAIDDSLSRLGLDHVDLYYLHAPDPKTPLEETVEAMGDLIRSGKVRAFGVSNFASWQIGDLNALCAERGVPKPAVSQVLYNLLVRQLDVEYFAFARAHPIHTTVYNPLAGGLLARAPSPGAAIPAGSRFEKNPMYRGRYWSEVMIAAAQKYAQLAREAGMDLVTLAYAWLASRPGVDSILAGPGSVAHLEAALDACAVTLPADLIRRVDDLHRALTGTDAGYAR